MALYGTFMQRQDDLKSRYVIINTNSWVEANEAMHHQFGKNWSYVYDEEGFADQPRLYGLSPFMVIDVKKDANGRTRYHIEKREEKHHA